MPFALVKSHPLRSTRTKNPIPRQWFTPRRILPCDDCQYPAGGDFYILLLRRAI